MIHERLCQILYSPCSIKRTALRGRRLHPIFGVIARPAWKIIAEPALPSTWDTSNTSRIQDIEWKKDSQAPCNTQSYSLPLLPPGPGGVRESLLSRTWLSHLRIPMAWRRGWDSNSRYLRTHAFQACTLSHSVTSPRNLTIYAAGYYPFLFNYTIKNKRNFLR